MALLHTLCLEGCTLNLIAQLALGGRMSGHIRGVMPATEGLGDRVAPFDSLTYRNIPT